ncbi:hypothetical protein KUCAC02_022639 [Chaenocephalus aceratus]|uniref:Uncharacterized protein n=1 Tax=Chaenocephalus aceratus TaxID=36190 RepID=A0ACB9XNC7_CHAAC|nr:hypothetical protein KUCAC02_022639 [Chaenocephalus aceratus]
MQTTILQMFKRKEETQNVLKIRKTTPTDDTVEAQREEEETQPEEVAAGPLEATTGYTMLHNCFPSSVFPLFDNKPRKEMRNIDGMPIKYEYETFTFVI